MNNEPSPSRVPTYRRIGRWSVYAVVTLITVIALLYAVENFRGARMWKAYQQQAAAKGTKLDFKEIIPAKVPDEENAAMTPLIQMWFVRGADLSDRWPDLYVRAEKQIASGKRTGNRTLIDLVAWEEALRTREGKSSRIHQAEREPAERAAAAQKVLQQLAPYADALNELKTAAQKTKVQYPINYSAEQPFAILLPHLAKLKEVASVLQLRASAHLAVSNSNAAFDDVQLLVWVTESLHDEPFLINQLVRIACLNIAAQPVWEGIQQQRWSEAQLKTIQEKFAAIDCISPLQSSIAAERAGGITTMEWVRRTGRMQELFPLDAENGLPSVQNASVMKHLTPSGWFRMEMANYGRLLDKQQAGVVDTQRRTMDGARVEKNNDELEAEIKSSGANAFLNHTVFARLLLPALRNASKRFGNGQATAHQVAIACAVERYRLANGKLPDTLESLVPAYFTHLPLDPMTGNAMRYERQSDSTYTLTVGWPDLAPGKSNLKPDALKMERNRWIWRSAAE